MRFRNPIRQMFRSIPHVMIASFVLVAATAHSAPPSEQRDSEMVLHVSWSAPDEVHVPLRMADGLPEIRGAINGGDVQMLLDTGSQAVVIDPGTARRCGVQSISSTLPLLGTKGVEQAHAGVLESMSVGSWIWRQFPCLIRTQGSRVDGILFGAKHPNLLGIEPLAKMCSFATFDPSRKEVIFGFRKPYRAGSGEASVPLEFRSGLPYVKISISGTECTVLVDTGASAELELDRDIAHKLGLTTHPRSFKALRAGVGSGKSANQTNEEAMISQLVVAGQSFAGATADIVADESKLGYGLLGRLRFTIDFERSRLWIRSENGF